MSTESIVPDTIDDAYPVAGQDNDSQGFRDNFNIIKTNTVYTKAALQNLDDNTAKTNADNVFFENTLSRFTALQASSTKVIAEFPVGGGGNNDINFENGHFFEVELTADVDPVRITNWPINDEYAEIYILLKSNGNDAWTATFASKYSNNTEDSTMYVIDGSEFAGTKTIAASNATNESKLIKCFTYDNGVNVFFEYLGKFVQAT